MQVKNSFDQETIIKIVKGAGIAASGAVALYLLDFVGTLEVGTLTPIIAAIVPILVNAIKEYMRES